MFTTMIFFQVFEVVLDVQVSRAVKQHVKFSWCPTVLELVAMILGLLFFFECRHLATLRCVSVMRGASKTWWATG